MSAVLPRSAALAAWLSLACGHRPTSAPLVPVVAVPFDAYGGAIYVPAVINGDSVWLMLDTGLSRTGLDRDWARSVGIARAPAPGGDEEAPTAAPATAVVDTIRLGELTLANHRVALYPLHGLSEASGRLEVGLVGHDVLQHYAVEIDYRQRRVRSFDAARYHYRGAGTTVRFTADADLPLLRAQVKVRGRRAIVEPRPVDGSPCDFDMSGLRLAARGPGLAHIMVDYVVPHSPSAEAGIAVGDELLLIDGRGVAAGDLSDARKALRADGEVRQLVLRREADTIRVALKLRRLL